MWKCVRPVLGVLKRPLSYSPYRQASTSIYDAFNNPTLIESHRRACKTSPIVGPFGIKELLNHDGFQELLERVHSQCNHYLDEALQFQHLPSADVNRRKMVQIFDDLSDAICQVADMGECLRLLHPNPNFRIFAERMSMQLQELVEQLNTNRALYEAIKSVSVDDQVPMDDVDRRVLEAFIADFHLSGIHLESSKRKRFVEETQKSFELGALFSRNALQPAVLKRGVLGSSLENVFQKSEDGRYVLLSHCYGDSPDATVRQIGYLLYHAANEDQEELLRHLLESRLHVAEHSGFSSFADRATKNTLGEGHDQITVFLTGLCEKLRPIAENEVTNIAALLGRRDGLNLFDLPYGTNLARSQCLPCSQEELRQYFSLGACMHGIQLLGEALFGIRLEVAEDVVPGELWHPSVIKLNVGHEVEGHLGTIYCDFFDRPDRPFQDCHYTIRGGRQLNAEGGYQSPVVVLQLHVGAYPNGRHIAPNLLSLGGVENLFHEFGHALHSMLGRTRYQHVTGTRCSTDFAEVPSTLMEKFALHPILVKKYARHWNPNSTSSRAVLSNEWAEQVHRSREVMHAAETLNQAILALSDQIFHGPSPFLDNKFSTTQIYHHCHNMYHPLPAVKDTAFHHRFTHLVNYGGRYYSYFMAQAVANLLWQECFEKDPLNRAAGEKYRRGLLAYGGERPAKTLVESVIGRPLTVSDMLQTLINYYDENSKQTVERVL